MLWPLLLLLALFVSLFPLVEFEYTGTSFLLVLFVAGVLQFLFGIDVLAHLASVSWFTYVWAGALYVALGVGYSFLRWIRFCADWRKDYDAMTPQQKDYAYKYSQPTALSSKSRITSWMAFWPWSGLWWLLSDLLVRLWTTLYTHFAAIYDNITARYMPTEAPPVPNKKSPQ